MRSALAGPVLALALVAGACNASGPVIEPPTEAPLTPITSVSPSPTVAVTASPTLAGASCDPQTGGSTGNVPDFVDVDTAMVPGADSITFEFAHPGTPESPSYSVRYVDQVLTDGEGAPVDLAGEAFVEVGFMAIGTDLSGPAPVPVYRGPTEFGVGFPVLLEAKEVGDFEARITWGLGLSRKACFVVDATSEHLTIAFAA